MEGVFTMSFTANINTLRKILGESDRFQREKKFRSLKLSYP